MEFELGVIVTSKEGVPSPEMSDANAKLKSRGFENAQILSAGRFFQLTIDAESLQDAQVIASGAAEKLLANPVIHEFDIVDLNREEANPNLFL